MNNALATYLEDHLAGGVYAMNLLAGIRDQYPGQPLGQFAGKILTEIEADHNTLKVLAKQVGSGNSELKELTASAAEMLSRLKLGRDAVDGLGTFEALELLSLGILGKLALWRALEAIRSLDSRLAEIDFADLIQRAVTQHATTEHHRIELARQVFA